MSLTPLTSALRAGLQSGINQTITGFSESVKSKPWLNPDANNSTVGTGSNKGFSSPILTYPLNVDSDPQQGHYILFYINERTTPKIKPVKKRDLTKIENQYDDFSVPLTKIKQTKGHIKSTALVLERLPKTIHKATIAMYMPPSVQVTYETKYGDQEIGQLAMAGQKAIDIFTGPGGSTATKLGTLVDELGGMLKESMPSIIASTVDAVAPGASALISLNRGTIVTPQMEMMFEGVGRRNFSYEFSFTPKSEQEAKMIENIIYHFKYYMMPSYTNSNTRREMNVPGTFDIRYMCSTGQNTFINKISTCFLSQVGVEYGADRYTAYKPTTGIHGKGAPPQKSKLTLQFNEINLLSQEDIKLGF